MICFVQTKLVNQYSFLLFLQNVLSCILHCQPNKYIRKYRLVLSPSLKNMSYFHPFSPRCLLFSSVHQLFYLFSKIAVSCSVNCKCAAQTPDGGNSHLTVTVNFSFCGTRAFCSHLMSAHLSTRVVPFILNCQVAVDRVDSEIIDFYSAALLTTSITTFKNLQRSRIAFCLVLYLLNTFYSIYFIVPRSPS